MNPYITQFDELIEQSDCFTKEQEDELIEHIFSNSIYQSVDEFSKSHISYYDALDIVQSNDSYLDESIEYLTNQHRSILLPLLLDSVSMKDLAYYLAYSDIELGTELLTELEFYKSKGRL